MVVAPTLDRMILTSTRDRETSTTGTLTGVVCADLLSRSPVSAAGRPREEICRAIPPPARCAGVTFQAALGNHDQVATIEYPPINMGGRRYYTYTRKNVRFFVLDSNVMDDTQLRWVESAMQHGDNKYLGIGENRGNCD